MAYNYPAVGNPPLPPGALNPPPPPPPMAPMPMGMMGPQQGMGQAMPIPGPIMPQGYIPGPMMTGQPPQPAPPGTHQQQIHMQQMQQNMLNPAMNDAPLEFNMNKNKPPMPISGEDRNSGRNNEESNGGNSGGGAGGGISGSGSGGISGGSDNNRRERRNRSDRRDRDRDRDRERERDRDRDRERRDDREGSSNSGSHSNSVQQQNQPPQQQPATPNSNNAAPSMQSPNNMQPAPIGGAPNNMWGSMMGPMGYPMMGMNMNMMGGGMMGDPSIMSMGQMGQYGMMGGMMPDGSIVGPDGTMIPSDPSMLAGPMVKEIIHCKSCTLFPPNPNAPPPTTRERPPGCRTIFVGGLPENTTEEIIQEIFERCGEMTTIRLSKKNFCHIRFVFESSVDAAIYLSGYRIRLGSNTDGPNTGRLHVDYAQARDDLYEWECRQRALQREQRHRERMEQERMRPPSPPPVVHYTDHEAVTISEKIKADETFSKAVQVVITWLERGDCSKRNANTFYTMIQSTNSHVRRLLGEKAQYEEELQRARELMKGRMQGIFIQFGQIERVFSAASHKKVWDHFTKAQRKNIEMWKKQCAEIKTVQLEEVLNERADEEMEVSDNEEDYMGNPKKKSRIDSEDKANLAVIKEENDSLRCQLEAYKNEVDLVRSDLKTELEQKEKQLKMLQQTLQGMQQQLMESKRRQSEDEIKVRELQARLKSAGEMQARLQLAKAEQSGDLIGDNSQPSTDTVGDAEDEGKADTTETPSSSASRLSDREAKLIGLLATFLHVHPFGAGVDYVWSYLQKMEPTLRPGEVESLMSRFPTVFRQELSGIGANMERRWQFAGFKTNLSI
ncbi:ecto-NOX disulfide-thiol exchanger 2-like [Zootermopsis nevadensis]|uniref:Ecto-NOX disulfide-thiol exchanger 1 n=1 Tax=Zootermopsis nevadensis TaxID=136037 RepID=A0A067QX53_ZOONE|nr:ecto-NOX disulfide-thiol exchanger 2-like [Zootermopsis nevadensis]KDR14923.1 Ecto-NOX disulfide-thiol exchanger 1 [Zootermopsis nevadensis]